MFFRRLSRRLPCIWPEREWRRCRHPYGWHDFGNSSSSWSRTAPLTAVTDQWSDFNRWALVFCQRLWRNENIRNSLKIFILMFVIKRVKSFDAEIQSESQVSDRSYTQFSMFGYYHRCLGISAILESHSITALDTDCVQAISDLSRRQCNNWLLSLSDKENETYATHTALVWRFPAPLIGRKHQTSASTEVHLSATTWSVSNWEQGDDHRFQLSYSWLS